MTLKKLTIKTAISLQIFFSLNAMANFLTEEVEKKFIPALEYFDCASHPFPQSTVNLVAGENLQNIGKKTSTAFLMGAQLYVVTSTTGEFEGLYVDYYNKDEPGLFLSREHLEQVIYIESNKLTPGNIIIDGYRLPIFSFELCEDEPLSPNFACFKFGYLSHLKVFSDVFYNAVKAKIARFNKNIKVPNINENHSRILLDTPTRWKYQKIYTEWDSDTSRVHTYVLTDLDEALPVHVMLGKLNIDRFGIFRGTENLVFKKNSERSLHTSEEKKRDIESLLEIHNCKQF